jgi:hypothetical protein
MLLELPWDRPFTIVDLRENPDLELMVTFYEMLSEVYGRENLVVLDDWIDFLTPPASHRIHDTQSKMEFHVLLSLEYSEHEREHAKPVYDLFFDMRGGEEKGGGCRLCDCGFFFFFFNF